MAKKKNFQKKHNFKHAASSEAAPVKSESSTGTAAPAAQPKMVAARPATAGATVRDFSYVKYDLKRIGLAAIVLVVLELGLYLLLTHTPAGDAIYSLVKV